MPIPPRKEIESVLEEIREPIVTSMREAWADWRKSSHAGVWRCKRSRANFVWEQMIERAHIAFSDDSKIRIFRDHETYSFLVKDRVLFRFKKADETGLTSNIPTQRALAFHDHEQLLSGLPEVHRVEIAYKLNRLETEIDDIVVVARNGNAVVWSYSLIESGEGVVPLPISAPPLAPVGKSVARLVRPRNNGQSKKRKKSD